MPSLRPTDCFASLAMTSLLSSSDDLVHAGILGGAAVRGLEKGHAVPYIGADRQALSCSANHTAEYDRIAP